MKTYFNAFFMCQSMFCAIPSPQIWDEKARDKMLLFLPVVGLELGLCWYALAWLCQFLALPGLLRALVLVCWPWLSTGFLHLDGFMDVTDAVKSCRNPERRREILKDPHVGSFAVIGIVLLCLAQFACFASVPEGVDLRILIFVPAVSRCGSVLAVLLLPAMSTSQYAGQGSGKGRFVVPGGMLLLFLSGGFVFCGKYGVVLLGVGAGYALALRRGYRSLGGMNGDIAGYALTIAELSGAAMLAMGGMV